MSRSNAYVPRIFNNNPEKNIDPSDFYFALKSGDIEIIREYIANSKTKINVVNKIGKSPDNKTPAHVILELDDSVASEKVKLNILKMLYDNGASIDLPDASNIWPLHLAVANQYKSITKWLISVGASADRTDESNNTPLHYAVMGKPTDCPKPTNVKDLTDSTSLDRQEFNKILPLIDSSLITIMDTNIDVNSDIIHMINTIKKLPLMHSEKFKQPINDAAQSFSKITSAVTYPINTTDNIYPNSNINEFNVKLDQLINQSVLDIKTNVLTGVDVPLDIKKNNIGWGPSDTNRILPSTIDRTIHKLESQLDESKSKLYKINDWSFISLGQVRMPQYISSVDNVLINAVFCPTCTTVGEIEESTLIKTMALLMYNMLSSQINNQIVLNIHDNYFLMDNGMYNDFRLGRFDTVYNRPNMLYGSTLNNMINVVPNLDATIKAELVYTVSTITDATGANVLDTCIRNNMRKYFSAGLDNYPDLNNELQNELTITNIDLLLGRPMFRNFRQLYKTLDNTLQKRGQTWLGLLNDLFIKHEAKFNAVSAGFFARYNMIDAGFLPDGTVQILIPGNVLNSANPQRTPNIITLTDAFKMLDMLLSIIMLNRPILATFDADLQSSMPVIYDQPYNNWRLWLNEQMPQIVPASGNSLLQDEPALILLYAILILRSEKKINKVIARCVKNIFDVLNKPVVTSTTLPVIPPANLTDPRIQALAELLHPVSDKWLYELLLPKHTFNDAIYEPVKSTIRDWSTENDLVVWFNTYINSLTTSGNAIEQAAYDQVLTYIYALHQGLWNGKIDTIDNVRTYLLSMPAITYDSMKSLVSDPKFRNPIHQFYGYTTRSLSSAPNPRPIALNYSIISANIEPIDLVEAIPPAPAFIKSSYDAESWTNYLVALKYRMTKLELNINKINVIISDIIQHINAQQYYYVLQIFLPALIKLTLELITSFDVFQDIYSNTKYFENINDKFVQIIGQLNTQLVSYFDAIKNNLFDIFKYYHAVVDYINTNNSFITLKSGIDRQLVTVGAKQYNYIDNVFTNDYVKADMSIDFLVPKINYDAVGQILSDIYKIDNITYHNQNILPPSDNIYKIFIQPDGTISTTYHDIIEYERNMGTVTSNSPTAGDNTQLNIEINAAGNPSVIEVLQSIKGSVLQFADNVNRNITQLKFANAFIAYNKSMLQNDWLAGSPLSIKYMIADYLILTKYQIIQKIIQDLYDYVASGSTTNQTYNDIISNINILTTNTLYQSDNTLIYVIIATMIDGILNRLIDYTTKSAITDYILHMIQQSVAYDPMLIDSVSYVKNKNIEKLSLKTNYIDLAQLVGHDDVALGQIEPDPDNIAYTTPAESTSFIHYIYNVNYQDDIESNENFKICYKIDPRIIQSVISGNNINFKNSDGNTALHLATEIVNMNAIQILLQNGAKRFKNIIGKYPEQKLFDGLLRHLEYSRTIPYTNYGSVKYISLPFNDLMKTRLNEAKYGYNIIKGMSMSLPISLLMYSHQFSNWLANYNYGFTYELKTDIYAMINRYFNVVPDSYPYDLFEIKNQTDLNSLINSLHTGTKLVQSNIKYNSTKLKELDKQIKFLNTQISGFQKTLATTTDRRTLNMTNRYITELNTKLNDLIISRDKLDLTRTIGAPDQTEIDVLLYRYMNGLDIAQNQVEVGMDLVSFYNLYFDQIANTRDTYMSVWANYFDKNISASNIFALVNNILFIIINKDKYDQSDLNDISTINKFYKIVADYILNVKNTSNLNDDPVQKQRYDHIVHIVRRLLSPAIIQIIKQQLYQVLSETSTTFGRLNSQQLMDKISTTTYMNYTLDTYITDVLPKITVRWYTKLYESRNDSVKLLNSTDEMYTPIVEIIRKIDPVLMTSENIFYKNIIDNLIPFINDTYQQLIHHIRLVTYVQDKYILTTSQLIDAIVKILSI